MKHGTLLATSVFIAVVDVGSAVLELTVSVTVSVTTFVWHACLHDCSVCASQASILYRLSKGNLLN